MQSNPHKNYPSNFGSA